MPPQASGFPADSVKAIIEDRQEGLWLGTASGLARVGPGEFDRALAGRSYRPTYELLNYLIACWRAEDVFAMIRENL